MKTAERGAASSRGRFVNTGRGATLQPIDIGHSEYIGLVDPDTAFWALIRRDQPAGTLVNGKLLAKYRGKAAAFAKEMKMLRFGLTPSAVYFNPTERCNLNCDYCYIPSNMRRSGRHMSKKKLLEAMSILKRHFKKTLSRGRLPEIVFHGSEPLLNRDALFAGIDKFNKDFRFGVQTNATLLDDEALEFLTSRGVSIGISLDGHTAAIADRARKTWAGRGSFKQVIDALERLSGYEGLSVICTVTNRNVQHLSKIVDLLHEYRVGTCLLNAVRCTREGARRIKPSDATMSKHFFKAMDRTYENYQKTGRKLVVANFANILLSIVAPTARRLMCDISPCGGGRCFFAVSAKGDIFPCSEFIGLSKFNGGNIFKGEISKALDSDIFKTVTGRLVEDIEPCRNCAVRHFCGAPCPAEAVEMNGGMNRTGAFCEFYEEQARYALRLIADGKENAFLWDKWDKDTIKTM